MDDDGKKLMFHVRKINTNPVIKIISMKLCYLIIVSFTIPHCLRILKYRLLLARNFSKAFKMLEHLRRRFTYCFIFLSFKLLLISMLSTAESPYLQAVHVLDPDIQHFKYYSSWNSDKWIEWVRNRYIEDHENRRNNSEKSEDFDSSRLYGQWVNIILIAGENEINSAFSEYSNRTYADDASRSDFYWSDFPFPVYVVVRKPVRDNSGEIQPQYIVHNCSGKKMYINAKVDPVSFNPVMIQTFFPKQVKNPKDKLKIPLVVCTKVSQVRGLLDEIKFQLGN